MNERRSREYYDANSLFDYCVLISVKDVIRGGKEFDFHEAVNIGTSVYQFCIDVIISD